MPPLSLTPSTSATYLCLVGRSADLHKPHQIKQTINWGYTWILWPSYLKSSSVTISVSIALTSFALSTCFILKNRGVDKIQTHSSGLEWRLLMYQTLQYRVATCNVTGHKTTQHPPLRYFYLFINCTEWKW